MYVHTAVQVNRNGALQFTHADLADVPTEDRPLLFRNLSGIEEPFGGMRILPNGRLSPTFYHAFPSLLAVAYRAGGLRAVLAVNPVLNVAALLAFYALASSLFRNRRWGLAGMALLALNPAQVWQARFSTAEVLTQFLLLAGFAFLVRWDEDPPRRTLEAGLGGLALGLAQLTRYDTLMTLAVSVPLLVAFGSDRNRQRGLAVALAPIALFSLQAWLHQRWIAPYYSPLGPIVIRILAAIALLSVATGVFCASPPGRRIAAWTGRRLPWAVSAGWLGWMAFNTLLRPTLHARTRIRVPLEALLERLGLAGISAPLIGPDSRSMLYLLSVFGPLALGLSLVGVLLFLWRPDLRFGRGRATAESARAPVRAWFWSGMAVTLVLTWRPFNELFMMWVVRRYTPTVIPWLTLGLLGMGVVVFHVLRASPKTRLFAATGPLLLVLALLPQLPATRQMARLRDWPGLSGWLAGVAEALPEDMALYTDQPHFGAPLRFLFNRRAYELQHPNPDRLRAFHALLDRAARREGSVLLLTQNDRPESMDGAVWEHIADLPLHSHIVLQTRHRIPDDVRPRGGDFALYRLSVRPAVRP